MFVGSLADEIVVWQSKYFIDGVAASQQKQIRESLTSLLSTAAEEGFRCPAVGLVHTRQHGWTDDPVVGPLV